MIICTSFGMFMPALRPPKTVPAGDLRTIQVRSRRKLDLDRLRALYMPGLGETIQLKGTDYQYRAYCTREELAEALALIALDVNYVKFKDTPRDYFKDYALTAAYERIWSAALNAFPQGSVFGNWQTGAARTGYAPTRTVVTSTTVTQRKNWWDDLDAPKINARRTLSDPFPDRDPTPAELAEIDADLDRWHMEWDKNHDPQPHTGPVVKNGRVDHSRCEHSASKNARERCRRRLRKAGQL